jgi:tRNA U34 5-carboxymethylaminomethyl modifying enzyme MnmG/GidA
MSRTLVRAPWGQRVVAAEALQSPAVRRDDLVARGAVRLDVEPSTPLLDVQGLETEYRYAGSLKRQARDIEKTRHYTQQRVPADFVFTGLAGLSRELQERLEASRTATVAEASRVPGVPPAALALIAAAINRRRSDAGLRSTAATDERTERR